MTLLSELLADRAWLGRYSVGNKVGIETRYQGDLTNATGDATASLKSLDATITVFEDRVATHPSLGVYDIEFSSGDTARPGLFELTFEYILNAQAQSYTGYVEIADSAPTFEALDDNGRASVERVWLKLADLFDSPYGGPHLAVYLQTRFDRERLAQLLATSIGDLNVVAQPHMTYNVENFPWAKWGALAERGLLIEAIKHLIRSYTEQPDVQGVSTARFDRRDYMDRWERVLTMEKEDYQSTMEHFKIAHMGLGAPSVLVSGGVYRELAPAPSPQFLSARPYRWVSVVY